MKTAKLRWFSVALASLLVLAGIGCGTVAHVEKDESVNFNKIRTYSWVNGKSLKERNSNNLIDAKLRQAVDQELQKSGMRETKSNPDVLIDYNIMVENSVRERRDPVYSRPYTRYIYNPYSRRIVRLYYPSQMVGYENSEIPFREGTITVHMIEPDSNKLIWQGWTSEEVNSRNLTSKEINTSIRSIMKKFQSGKV